MTMPIRTTYPKRLQLLGPQRITMLRVKMPTAMTRTLSALVNADNGGLSVGPAAAPRDVCLVFAIAKAANYEDFHSAPAEVAVDAGELDTTGISKPTYATLRPGLSIEPQLPVSSVDHNGVPVTWGAWSVVGDDVDGADDMDVCSVDASGVVTAGSAASENDTCVVSAKISNPNYEDSAAIEVASLTVAAQGMFARIVGPIYDRELTLRGLPAQASNPGGAIDSNDEGIDGVTLTYELIVERGERSTPTMPSAPLTAKAEPSPSVRMPWQETFVRSSLWQMR